MNRSIRTLIPSSCLHHPLHRYHTNRYTSRVPEYPSEDAKQRASSISRRRGGNCPNTLEVLQQLHPISPDDNHASDETPEIQIDLVLLSTLPSTTLPDTQFIIESLNPKPNRIPSPPSRDAPPTIPVNFSHTFYRPSVTTAASSYIIQSQTTNSRTIVNYNALDEMTVPEFQNAIISLLNPSTNSPNTRPSQNIWFHFEGRIPDVLCQCIKWLRSKFPNSTSNTDRNVDANPDLEPRSTTITISVEVEKPQRPGLEDLADLADVVFYSRSWAEGREYTSAQNCLIHEARRIKASRSHTRSDTGNSLSCQRGLVLCCTWGAEGASALELDIETSVSATTEEATVNDRIVTRPSWRPPPALGSTPTSSSALDPNSDQGFKVIDTIGAGDTWIAGMLFCLMARPGWSMQRKVDFANELAGRKVRREGFVGLGRDMGLVMGE